MPSKAALLWCPCSFLTVTLLLLMLSTRLLPCRQTQHIAAPAHAF
jgi:hypothetical protein